MTMYQSNDDVRPTGEEAGEFIEPDAADRKMYTSEPLEDEDGNTYVIQQQNVGPGNQEGGGEFPDPNTPPRFPAPGAAEDDADRDE
jgi:hypothetical protein